MAIIDIPFLLTALTGKGPQVDRHHPTRYLPVYVPTNEGANMIYRMPPPCIGTWDNPIGMGVKKTQRRGIAVRKKQSIQRTNTHTRTKAVNKPVLKCDLSVKLCPTSWNKIFQVFLAVIIYQMQ